MAYQNVFIDAQDATTYVMRDHNIFCLFHFDVELCQGNAKSTNCISQFLLQYRKVSNMFDVTYLDSR